MYFSSTLDLTHTVYYAHRSFDPTGVYMPIQQYLQSASADSSRDWMGELATETHVTNVLAEPSLIELHLTLYPHIDFTYIRLDETYRDII